MTASLARLAAVALITLTASGGVAIAADAGAKKKAIVHEKTTSGREARNNWNSFTHSSSSKSDSKSNTCDTYYDKWKSTGTGFWRGRYYSCIYGGW